MSEPITPRFSVTSVDLFSPVIFITLFSLELPVRYSATVTSMPMPLHLLKAGLRPVGVAGAQVDKEVELDVRAVAQDCHGTPLLRVGVHDFAISRPLADAEDHELGGLQRRDADQADQPAVVEVVLRHGRAVALHEVGLLGLVAEQRAALPFVEQEILDRAPHVGPQRVAVGLEHRPLRALVDRALEVGEVAPQVDVLPFGIGADRARAPQPEAAAFEEAEAVDALGIEHILLALC